LEEAHKTGLGSSAALVTALTAAILSFYLPIQHTGLLEARRISHLHNLAQAAHCAAQGKVGSGFDVATAVYGSCVYRRFSPSVLETLGIPGEAGFPKRIKAVVENADEQRQWDTQILKDVVAMPPGIRLVMCDVDCGSQTVGMVKKVLSWRKSNPEQAKVLWDQLHENNESLGRLLKSSEAQQQQIKDNLSLIRSKIREMSKLADTPIEPPSQQHLIDACSELEGVIGGVVPGAGGYDAIALLVHEKEDVLGELNDFLAKWAVAADGDEKEDRGSVRMLGVRQEQEGIRLEKPEEYTSWLR
jgi:phosphomevalonate kinase